MRNHSLTRLFLAFAVLFSAVGLPAQTTDNSTAQAGVHPKYSVWPTKTDYGYLSPLEIVTLSQPGVRHKCNLRAVSTDSLTCGHGEKAVVYQRNDIAAIISPPRHSNRHAVISCYVIGAASLAGSFFVPIEAVAITLRVVSGYSFVMPAWDNDTGDHNGDILLYQHSDTPLSVTLRQPARRHS